MQLVSWLGIGNPKLTARDAQLALPMRDVSRLLEHLRRLDLIPPDAIAFYTRLALEKSQPVHAFHGTAGHSPSRSAHDSPFSSPRSPKSPPRSPRSPRQPPCEPATDAFDPSAAAPAPARAMTAPHEARGSSSSFPSAWDDAAPTSAALAHVSFDVLSDLSRPPATAPPRRALPIAMLQAPTAADSLASEKPPLAHVEDDTRSLASFYSTTTRELSNAVVCAMSSHEIASQMPGACWCCTC